MRATVLCLLGLVACSQGKLTSAGGDAGTGSGRSTSAPDGGTSAPGAGGADAGTADAGSTAADAGTADAGASGGGGSAADAGNPGDPADAGESSDGGAASADPIPAVHGTWAWENPLPNGLAYFAIWGASKNDVWAAGESGVLMHFDGSSWTRKPSPVSTDLHALWGASGGDIWAAGDAGVLLHYDGSAWARVASGTTAPLGVLSGTSSTDIWVSSAAIPVNPQITTGGPAPGAILLHYDGTRWTAVPASAPTAVAALAPDDVWVGSCDGKMSHFDGSSWTPFNALPGCARAIAGTPGGSLFADFETGAPCDPHTSILCPVEQLGSFSGTWSACVGAATELLSTGGGTVWSFGGPETLFRSAQGAWTAEAAASTSSPIGGVFYALAITGPNDAWIAGANGRLIHFDGSSLSEPNAVRTNLLWSMSGTSECDVWAAGNYVLMHRDCTGDWSLVDLAAAGVVPPGGEQYLAVAAGAPDDVWVSGRSLLHFDGTNWTSETPPANGKLLAFPGQLWVAAEAGLYRRDEAGWTCVLAGRGQTTTGEFFESIWGSGPNDIWVIGGDDSVTPVALNLHHFDGVSWSIPWSEPFKTSLIYGAGSGADDVWLADPEGVRHFDGSGWTTFPGFSTYGGLASSGRGQLWLSGKDAAGTQGIFKYDGKAWTNFVSEGWTDQLAVAGDLVFAYGTSPNILSRPR